MQTSSSSAKAEEPPVLRKVSFHRLNRESVKSGFEFFAGIVGLVVSFRWPGSDWRSYIALLFWLSLAAYTLRNLGRFLLSLFESGFYRYYFERGLCFEGQILAIDSYKITLEFSHQTQSYRTVTYLGSDEKRAGFKARQKIHVYMLPEDVQKLSGLPLKKNATFVELDWLKAHFAIYETVRHAYSVNHP